MNKITDTLTFLVLGKRVTMDNEKVWVERSYRSLKNKNEEELLDNR